MAFMKPQIVKGTWVEWEDEDGGMCVAEQGLQHDDIPQDRMTTCVAFGARLSAPGYLDCTEWALFETESEAAQHLIDTYYDTLGIEDADLAELRSLEALL